jgi:hypothetical protein
MNNVLLKLIAELLKLDSCNALLRKLLLCIRSYLQKVLSYIHIFNFGHLSWGHYISCLFFEARMGPRAKILGNTASGRRSVWIVSSDTLLTGGGLLYWSMYWYSKLSVASFHTGNVSCCSKRYPVLKTGYIITFCSVSYAPRFDQRGLY